MVRRRPSTYTRPMLAIPRSNRPGILAWILGVTFLIGLAPIGSDWLFRGVLLGALVATACCVPRLSMRMAALASLVVIGLAAQQWMMPLEREFLTPLDEGMVMDMPITIPRASMAQVTDDLKARDMVFCRFPEIHMVVGKAGRADTATDPAPLDMIETMIDFRPQRFLLAARRGSSRPMLERQSQRHMLATAHRPAASSLRRRTAAAAWLHRVDDAPLMPRF